MVIYAISIISTTIGTITTASLIYIVTSIFSAIAATVVAIVVSCCWVVVVLMGNMTEEASTA